MDQRTGGMVWNLIIFAAFVYAFLIMRGIVNTSVDIKTLQKPSTFVKIVVYAGMVLFGLLIVMDVLGK